MARSGLKKCDVILLDPPRTGAGKEVVHQMTKLRPRSIIYVACDPAALGRDVALLAERGYDLSEISSWDAFPMTHHVESIAHFVAR